MGLFSSPRRALGSPGLRFPIRLHSEHRVPLATVAALARLWRQIARFGGAAGQDARVIGALLVAAFGALLLVVLESPH